MLKFVIVAGIGLLGITPVAVAETPATVYCINGAIRVERNTMAQARSGRGDSEVCIVGPGFDFQPDGVAWAKKNLGAGEGGKCSCR